MSVIYYGPGEHDSGFVGFRVTKVWSDIYRQKYFSTSAAQSQTDDSIYFRYQRVRAEHQDACWAVESLEYQYQQFVTTNNGNTKPERGIGIHGIVILFAHGYGGKFEPGFSVSQPGKPQKRFLFKNHPFTEAWRLAADHWAQENGILEADHVRIMGSPPSPEQFKRLRHQMNHIEGYDIPVESLRVVFQEQREQLANSRTSRHLQTVSKPPISSLESDVRAWFESEQPSTS